MPTLEQVSRRVFADPSWFLKTMIGAILIVPPFSFWALGYLYRMAAQGRRGQPPELPDWEEWRELFFDGARFGAIVGIFAVLPMVACWGIALPMRWLLDGTVLYWAFWLFLYMPFAPVLLLSAPMAAAALYRYMRLLDFRDTLRVDVIFRMVVVAREQLFVPTLAYIGSMAVLFPVFPYALFTGGAVYFYYASRVFHELESAAREKTSARMLVRR